MELLVVLAIIISITTVVLTSQSAFNKTLLLANTAYDIALTLRLTESLGIGTLAVSGVKNAGRGAHFDKATPGFYITFGDTYPVPPSCAGKPTCNSGDDVYTASQDTPIQTYTLGNGMKITDFCVYPSGSNTCASTGLTSLDIVFARPNPDVFVRANGVAGISYTSACLKVASLQGGARFIRVAPSGAIIANALSCP